MANSFRRCVIVRFLSYILFAVVGSGGALAAYQGDVFWSLCFFAMFLSGAIYLIVLTDQANRNSDNKTS